VLRRITEHKKDEIILGWSKLHEELHNLYPLPNIGMTKAEYVACVGEECIQVYGRKIINIDLREIGSRGGMDWIHLAQDRDQ
jgi:hypothetical protein